MFVDTTRTAIPKGVPATESKGEFVRPASAFRNWITAHDSPGPTGRGGFKAQAGRYHLYVALACPWASRTLMVRKLKRLDSLITVSITGRYRPSRAGALATIPGRIATRSMARRICAKFICAPIRTSPAG